MASINQTGTGIRLPNFCNLGVMLRSLLIANLLVVAAALLRSTSTSNALLEFQLLAAFAEPALIASLLVLCAARRVLHSMGYAASIAAIAAFEIVVAWGVWSLGAELVPGRRTMPFTHLALLTLLVTAAVLGYFDLRSRALSPAIAEARIQALQSRIRPHFLYNSINAVLSLMRSEPRRAERALEDMADLFRVLMADNRTLAPIANEVELARQYLAIESLRLGDRLRVAWRIDTMPADALVPPLVLQPLVENAVYHGIEPSPQGGEIAIEVGLAGGQLVMTLTNPLPPEIRHSAGNKMAIANIRERLQLHFDAEASMKSEARDGTYRVAIRMPYLTAA
ncbi:MAG TPA: histidine kinase [Usitatibacter sp.]|nr:histidine kinase [Usitatibacter sp.]